MTYYAIRQLTTGYWITTPSRGKTIPPLSPQRAPRLFSFPWRATLCRDNYCKANELDPAGFEIVSLHVTEEKVKNAANS